MSTYMNILFLRLSFGLSGAGYAGTGGDRKVNWRVRREIISTRGNLPTKQGTVGKTIPLYTNYLSFKQYPDCHLQRYRVDFRGDCEKEPMPTYMKKKIMERFQDKLPLHIFDGTILFCYEKLFAHKNQDQLVLTGAIQRENEEVPVEVKIRTAGEIQGFDHAKIAVYNIIMRKAMEGLNLKIIGRDYYDYDAKMNITFPQNSKYSLFAQ